MLSMRGEERGEDRGRSVIEEDIRRHEKERGV